MSAPTPISALVHSSTLVTAGVVLLIKFNLYITHERILRVIILIVVLTLLHSGIFSIKEIDLKKVVALSTLNQLSLIMLSLVARVKILTFFHLNTHAVFKRLLFLNVGVLIHLIFSLQDKRRYSLNLRKRRLVMIRMGVSLLALMGFSFFSGFFSKDLILEKNLFSLNRVFYIGLVYSIIGFTFIYRIRILRRMMGFMKIQTLNYRNRRKIVRGRFLILRIMSIFFGKFFLENFFSLKVFF